MNRIELLNFLLNQFSASALLSDILGEMSNNEFVVFVNRIGKRWGVTLPCDCGVHSLEAICCKKEEYEPSPVDVCAEPGCGARLCLNEDGPLCSVCENDTYWNLNG